MLYEIDVDRHTRLQKVLDYVSRAMNRYVIPDNTRQSMP